MDERTYRTLVVAGAIIALVAVIRTSPPGSKVLIAILLGLLFAGPVAGMLLSRI